MKISRERIAEARDLFPLPLSTKPPIWHCRCAQCVAGRDLLTAIDERDEMIAECLRGGLRPWDKERAAELVRGSRFEVK